MLIITYVPTGTEETFEKHTSREEDREMAKGSSPFGETPTPVTPPTSTHTPTATLPPSASTQPIAGDDDEDEAVSPSHDITQADNYSLDLVRT